MSTSRVFVVTGSKYHQLDITDQKSIDKLRDYLVEHHGGLDVLVNNAGIAFRGESPLSGAQATVGCNFFGTLNVCEALFPLIRYGGSVVNVSSISAINAFRRLSESLKDRFNDPCLTVEGQHLVFVSFGSIFICLNYIIVY